MLRWSTYALPALAVGLFAWGAAWFLWTGEGRSERDRRAAALLAVAGTVLMADPAMVFLAAEVRFAYAAAFVGASLLLVLPFLQLRLLATFPTRAAVALKVPALGYAALVLTGVGLLLGLASPGWAVEGMLRMPRPAAWHAILGFLGKLAWAAWLVTLAYGALVTGLAATGAPGARRARLQPWMTAYVAFAIASAVHVFLDLTVAGSADLAASAWATAAVAVLAALPLALFATFALQAAARARPASGVRARRFVGGTTVVAAFTFPIVLGGEVLERLIDVPGPVAGVIVAVILAAVLRPIQHLADRVARRVVQDVEVTPGAAELYRSAIEGAFGDGEINEKEHRTLERLGRQLGLSPEEASRIQRETLRQLRG